MDKIQDSLDEFLVEIEDEVDNGESGDCMFDTGGVGSGDFATQEEVSGQFGQMGAEFASEEGFDNMLSNIHQTDGATDASSYLQAAPESSGEGEDGNAGSVTTDADNTTEESKGNKEVSAAEGDIIHDI